MARPSTSVLARGLDAVLDGVVVALAGGTVAYHVALLLDAPRLVLGVLWGALAVAGLVLTARSPDATAALDPAPVRSSTIGVVVAFTTVGAVVLRAAPGSSRWWWAFWAAAVAALLGGVGSVVRARQAAADGGARTGPSSVEVAVVLLFAVLLGVAALVTSRPDLDDVYVVNRSVYVEQHSGTVPTQDVVFADQRHSGQRAPLRSPAFEVLVGVVAAAAPVAAATVAYLWLAPLCSMLAVLAIWHLVRTLGSRAPALAVAVTVGFLLLDGSAHAGFGNLHFARMWQGKAVLVGVLVPLIWSYALRWSRDGSRRHLVLLVTANIAAAGVSSTGLFVAPLATGIVGGAVAVATRSWRRLPSTFAAAGYPLVLAVLNRTADSGLETASSGTANVVAPWARWTLVFGRPAIALSAVAVALGWVAARDRASRAVSAVAPLFVLVALYGPRLLDPLRTVAPGASAVLWRALWVLPVPALVGMAATIPWSGASRSRVARRAAGAVVVGAMALFVVETTPVMSSRNRASVGRPEWKTGGDRHVAARLIEEVPAGSVVAGPFEVDRVVPLLASNVRAVDPRPGWYAGGVDPEPRTLVQHALTTGIAASGAGKLAAALDELGVDAVALPMRLRGDPVRSVLERQAFVLHGIEGQYLVFTRLAAPERGPVS